MKIRRVRSFEGPNYYSLRPVVEMTIDLDADEESGRDAFAELGVLPDLFPGLWDHYCSRGYPGGFTERLREGTGLCHVVEHLALELQAALGYDVIYGRTREIGSRRYSVVFEYECREVGEEAGRKAVEVISSLLAGQTVDAGKIMGELKKVKDEFGYGPSTAALVAAARARNIPVTRLDATASLLQLGYGKALRRIQATVTENTGCLAVDIACDKQMTKDLLARAGIPVPRGRVVRTEEEAVEVLRELGSPVALKPRYGRQGKGVYLNLDAEAEVRRAYGLASREGREVIVERHVCGRNFRFLVAGGKVVAVSERRPPFVVGDGVHTIEELIEIGNRNPDRGEGHEKPLTKVTVDEVVLMTLARSGKALGDILERGEVLFLRESANLSTGGTAEDVTGKVCRENLEVAERAARIIGLDVAGVDVVCPDPSLPLVRMGGVVIEVNAAPGLRMHHFPSSGQPRDVAAAIIDSLYPEDTLARIPVVAVTGTNGKTTTSRILAYILEREGLRVGLTTTHGVYIGGEKVLSGDMTGPVGARTVLTDRSVEAAVLETARGGIIRGGLGYDRSQVGVVLNVQGDHVGQDGIDSNAELAKVKSLVAETVLKEGWAVLNADDTYVSSMKDRASAPVIFFTLYPDRGLVQAHLRSGGRVVTVLKGKVAFIEGNRITILMPVTEIPVTLRGLALHNVENALAAASAAWGLGIPPGRIAEALGSFINNPGRLEKISDGPVKVYLDYGHNPEGISAVARAIRKTNPARLTGVVGVPGDRSDESIIETGMRAAADFDRLYFKEDRDKRGRAPGEVACLLQEGALRSGRRDSRVIEDEVEAAITAITEAAPGDTVVVFYEDYERLRTAVADLMGADESQKAKIN